MAITPRRPNRSMSRDRPSRRARPDAAGPRAGGRLTLAACSNASRPSAPRRRRWRASRPASPDGRPRRRTRRACPASHSGTSGRVVVDVWREHRRGPRLDDAVGEALEDPGVQPRSATQVPDERLVARRASCATSSSDPPGRIGRAIREPEAERAVRRAGDARARPRRARPRRPARTVMPGRVQGGDRPGASPRGPRPSTAVAGRRVSRSWAPSLRTPVGSPVVGSRTISPSGGSGVSRSIPAARQAGVLTQPVCPS